MEYPDTGEGAPPQKKRNNKRQSTKNKQKTTQENLFVLSLRLALFASLFCSSSSEEVCKYVGVCTWATWAQDYLVCRNFGSVGCERLFSAKVLSYKLCLVLPFFFFENREFAIYYQARKQIASFGEYGGFDLTGSVDVSYLNGLTRGESSKFEEDMPLGIGKSWANKAGAGFIADSRDSEFSPVQGIRYEVSYEVSSSIFGSDYAYSDLEFDLRHYKEIFDGVVLANKLNFESIHGDAPFWDLSIIGGNGGLRGYHLDRFRGNQSVMHLLELRTWLFSVLNDEIRVGSQLFWDTGRVFSGANSDAFFDTWKHSYGGGMIFTLFSPDLMLRADVGFSDETFRFYFGTGYIF